jgi:hypothetical protein
VLNKRAGLISPSHNGPPCYASPLRYYPGSCFVVHAARGTLYWPSRGGGGARAGSTLASWLARTRTARICNCLPELPAVVAKQDVQLAHLRPRSRPTERESTLGGLGRFSWAAIGWAVGTLFNTGAVCMEKVITTPSREPVPRPRKGNPLGGPVRGIFISSPSHWPVSATVESRESGVVVVQGWWDQVEESGWPARGTHNRDPGSSGPMKRGGNATWQGAGRGRHG